jgi:hypothetical protein
MLFQGCEIGFLKVEHIVPVLRKIHPEFLIALSQVLALEAAIESLLPCTGDDGAFLNDDSIPCLSAICQSSKVFFFSAGSFSRVDFRRGHSGVHLYPQ